MDGNIRCCELLCMITVNLLLTFLFLEEGTSAENISYEPVGGYSLLTSNEGKNFHLVQL